MTTSGSAPLTGVSTAAPPIEAWLKATTIAAITSGVASCFGSAIMYMSYYQHRYHTQPNTLTGPMTLWTYFSVRTFLFCLGWSVLYVLSYREWTTLRRVTDNVAGTVGVAILYGITLWALMHFVLFPSKIGETPMAVIFWLRYVVFTAPPIVWAVGRFSPLAPPRPIFARRPPSPAMGLREIGIGVVTAIPALLVLVWLKTDPSVGYLMILAFFIALGAVGLLAIAAGLVLGGIWTWFGLPGRLIARLSPLLLLAAGIVFVFFRPFVYRP